MTINIPLLRKAVEFAEAAATRQRTYEQTHPFDVNYQGDSDLDPTSDPSDLTWNQSLWASTKVQFVSSPEEATLEHCGTAYCLAGFVNSQHPGYEVRAEATENVCAEANGGDAYRVNLIETIDGKFFGHSAQARDTLGLTQTQAERLFSGGNTIEDVRRIAEGIANERL